MKKFLCLFFVIGLLMSTLTGCVKSEAVKNFDKKVKAYDTTSPFVKLYLPCWFRIRYIEAYFLFRDTFLLCIVP